MFGYYLVNQNKLMVIKMKKIRCLKHRDLVRNFPDLLGVLHRHKLVWFACGIKREFGDPRQVVGKYTIYQ